MLVNKLEGDLLAADKACSKKFNKRLLVKMKEDVLPDKAFSKKFNKKEEPHNKNQ
jgi:hypothetical protein